MTRWDQGYDVYFPGFARRLGTPYRSLASAEFATGLERLLPPPTIRGGVKAASLDREGVTLESGERIAARAVIDCRGFSPTPHLSGGWQVFMGRRLRTYAPHGIDGPVIMDATVAQLGGYRFVYVLPLGADALFVEDTYYQDTPLLDRSALSSRLDEYCNAQGWDGELLGSEAGAAGDHGRRFRGPFQDAQRIAGVAGRRRAPAASPIRSPATRCRSRSRRAAIAAEPTARRADSRMLEARARAPLE
jgi:lycopene beta-cyclase